MIKKIIIIVIILGVLSGGTVFALDRLSTQQKIEEQKRLEEEKERYKLIEEQTKAEIEKKKQGSTENVIEKEADLDEDVIHREWKGLDGLNYTIDAVKNPDNTYTGNIIGKNMYDNFVEYNFKFEEISSRAFEDLLKK